jgi:hypothetical protein
MSDISKNIHTWTAGPPVGGGVSKAAHFINPHKAAPAAPTVSVIPMPETKSGSASPIPNESPSCWRPQPMPRRAIHPFGLQSGLDASRDNFALKAWCHWPRFVPQASHAVQQALLQR